MLHAKKNTINQKLELNRKELVLKPEPKIFLELEPNQNLYFINYLESELIFKN